MTSAALHLAAIVLAAGVLAGCDQRLDTGEGGGVVRFSVLSTQPAGALARDWAPIVEDLDAATGLKVEPVFSNSGANVVEAMRARRSDLGWFSNLTGLEVVRRGGGEVFARTFDPTGADGYTSVLIVGAKSKITLERVLKCDRTLTLSLGEPLSASGTLAAETYLFAPRGVAPTSCFKQVRAASPQANLAAVAAGQADVASNTSTALTLNRRDGRHEADQVQVIWRSPTLPEDPIVWRKDLDPAIKEKLRQFLITYGQGEGPTAAVQRANLARIGIGGFKPADNSHLLPIREMEATQMWLEAKAGGDKARIDAARRALADITAQRQALEARTRAPAAAQ